MKRRSSLRSDSGQEELSSDAEHNLRKRKSINYHNDDEDYYYYEEDDCDRSLTHEGIRFLNESTLLKANVTLSISNRILLRQQNVCIRFNC